MSIFYGAPPQPLYKHFFIVDGECATQDTFDNLFTQSLEEIGSCLFLHEQEGDQQRYIFYAITTYKAPFRENSPNYGDFAKEEYFLDKTDKGFSKSWWLYIEEGYTTDGFLFPNNTHLQKEKTQYIHIEGDRKKATQEFFSKIVPYYHTHKPTVEGVRHICVGPLYGQPLFFPQKNFLTKLEDKLLKKHFPEEEAKDIHSMIIRGGSILKSAHDWKQPSIGRTDPSMVDIVRGVQWQFMMAYSGFELLWKGSFLFLEQLSTEHQSKLSVDLQVALSQIPSKSPKGFADLFFTSIESVLHVIYDTTYFQEHCFDTYLCFQTDKTAFDAYWKKQKTKSRSYLDLNKENQRAILKFAQTSPTTPRELVSLATSIRHAIAHGMLSPSKVVEWYMFPSLVALLRGIIWLGQKLLSWMDEQLKALPCS